MEMKIREISAISQEISKKRPKVDRSAWADYL